MKKKPERELKHISENLLTLRRRLKISQSAFIEAYAGDSSGKPLISVPTLSNMENGATAGVEALAGTVAEKLAVDKSVFRMDPDDFARNIELFLGEKLDSREDGRPLPGRVNSSEILVRSLSDYLMDAVMQGKMRPGSKIPSDRELGARFGVGRTTLREALRVLSCLGIVTILPGHGTYLASKNTGFHVSLTWTVLLGENSVNNLIDVRNELEAASARLAAQNAGTASAGELTGIYEAMKIAFTEANFKNFLELDLDFHLAIARCSQNPIIHDLLATSRRMLKVISKSGMITMEDLENIYAEHGDIYKAIMERDSSGAEAKMKAHLANAKKRYHF